MQDVPYTDQLAISDNDLFRHLTLPGKADKQLKAAVKENDLAGARRIVAEHFRTRSEPRWPFYMHGTAWMEIDGRGSVLEKADGLMQHRFKNSWPDFQWVDMNDGSTDPDWSKMGRLGGSISRGCYAVELSTAFALTGQQKYLRKAFELMQSFVRHMPFVLEPGFYEDHDRYFGGRAHDCLAVPYRCFRWMDFMHSGALQIPGLLSDEEVVWLVRQMWFLTMQHYRFVGDAMRRDNHHLVSHGHQTFEMGAMFPEFDVSKALVDQGIRTINHHFDANIFEDGGYAEHSTKYQYHIHFHYLHPLAMAKANGIKLFNQKQEARLRRWAEFTARACQPDGIICQIGDEYGGSLAYFFATLAAPVMDKELAAMSRALGFEPGKMSYESPAQLKRQFKGWSEGTPPRIGLSPYYNHDGTVKKPASKDLPQPASKQYPNGGYTFFRQSWDKDADFLAISHYTDSMPHGHAHWDMMSFILHTQGKTLIGDPATWFYGHGAPDPSRNQEYRGYHMAMDAHNCLVMDDDTLKPLKALGHRCCWGGWPPKHGLGLFQAGGPIEVVEVWHDAYTPTRHRRFVVSLKGIGAAFVDLLWRDQFDLRPHQYSQLYHFEGDVEITPENPGEQGALRAELDGARCLILPGRESENRWKTWRDSYLIGLRGVGKQSSQQGPWVAQLTRHQQGPSVFTNFILTQSAPAEGTPELRYLGTNPAKTDYHQHDGLSAHSLDLGEQGTLLLASCPYDKALESEELTTDADLAVVLLDRKGKVKNWAVAYGSKLSVNGKPLVRGKKKAWAQG